MRARIFLGTFFWLLPVASHGEPLSFGKEIRPILSSKCFQCHGPDAEKREGELRLDVQEDAFRGGKHGVVMVPGQPEKSPLIERIFSTDPDDIMPPPEAHLELKPEEKEALRAWIAEGAPYALHWSFVAPVKQALPTPGAHPVDAWVDHRLKTMTLEPSPKADEIVLVRRAYLDLLGLPPSPDEIDAYFAEPEPERWTRLLDRLLASPHCAERLAMPWLDAARYADSNGYSIDDHRDMWGWRDWVIHAFSSNKPYDQFIIEQLAGDLLPDATEDQKAATGFLRNGMNTHEGGTIGEEYRVAYTVDKVDTVATSMLGLTLKCAQCHDHKFDPLLQKDFYRFFAFFNESSEGGKGATNGNTKPMMAYQSPLGSGMEELKERIAILEQLKLHPSGDLVDLRERWLASLHLSPPAAPPATLPWEQVSKTAVKWIWAGTPRENQRVTFSRAFSLEALPDSAWLFLTCDDEAQIKVNGQPVAEIKLWSNPVQVPLAPLLVTGKNSIEVAAKNNGGVGGMIAVLAWKTEQGWTIVPTDASWTASIENESPQPTTLVGTLGDAPWGDVTRKLADADDKAGLAIAVAKPAAQRSSTDWATLNEAFVEAGVDGSERMGQTLASIAEEIRVLERTIKQGKTTVMIMDQMKDPRKTHVLTRGQYDQPAAEVLPGVPEIFPALDGEHRATRLDLARWMVRNDHPLTARVAVNRFWQMIYGVGLVETADDFGSQGAWPSHPELLDWLAVDFMEHGWDVRYLLKLIMTSETYQRSAVTTAAQQAADPLNHLYARSPRPRLEAELVRDVALRVSGLLQPKIGGPGVYPPQPDGLWRDISHFGHPTVFTAQHYYPDQGPRRYRRSLYTFWKRTSAPPLMAMFDAPTRETCSVRRLKTNTPLQALVTMNSPEFLTAALALGEQLAGRPADEKVLHGFRLVCGRAPTASERQTLVGAYQKFLDRFTKDPEATTRFTSSANPEGAADAMIASILLNLDEALTRP